MPRIAKLNDEYFFNFSDHYLYHTEENREKKKVKTLPNQSYTLLEYFCEKPNEVISRKEIKKLLRDGYMSDEALRTAIRTLRQQNDIFYDVIQNVHSAGYMYIGKKTEEITDDKVEAITAGGEVETETVHSVMSAAASGSYASIGGIANNNGSVETKDQGPHAVSDDIRELPDPEDIRQTLKDCDDGEDALETMAWIVNKSIERLEGIQSKFDNAVKRGDEVWREIYGNQLAINRDLLNRELKQYREMRMELDAKCEEIQRSKTPVAYSRSYSGSHGRFGVLEAPRFVDNYIDIDDVDIDGFIAWYAEYVDEYKVLNATINEYEQRMELSVLEDDTLKPNGETEQEIDLDSEITDIEGTAQKERDAYPIKTWVYILVVIIVIAVIALGLSLISTRTPSNNSISNESSNNSSKTDPFGALPEEIKEFTYEDAEKLLRGDPGFSMAEYRNYIDHEIELLLMDITHMHDKIVYEMEKPAPIGGEISWSRQVFIKFFEEYYQALMDSAEKEYEKEKLAIEMEYEGGTGAAEASGLTQYAIYRNVLNELEYRYKLVQQMP